MAAAAVTASSSPPSRYISLFILLPPTSAPFTAKLRNLFPVLSFSSSLLPSSSFTQSLPSSPFIAAFFPFHSCLLLHSPQPSYSHFPLPYSSLPSSPFTAAILQPLPRTQIMVKIVKNKHAPPFKEVQLELEFGKGISRDSEVIELGCKHKFITKAGVAYYSLNGQSFHGKDALKRYIAENEVVREELMIKLKEKLTQADTNDTSCKDEISRGDTQEEIISIQTTDEEVVAEVEAQSIST
ncbi:hypothetical protein BHM03_00003710 [Ensete ventricosum]|uniref:RecA family profile 2 domain-containing protein n=1 Tax=Ensete ventricosum TaxID=4639 RepID=A0A445MA40_ENSVE|nr:hypothetical protein BHM03_00003710 [Ensete ventricosum]